MFDRINPFKKLDPRIMSELKTQRRTIRQGLICVAVTSGLTAAMVPFSKYAVAAIEAKDMRLLGILCLLVILLFVMKYWFTRGQTYYLSKAAAALTSDLRIRIFRKLQKLPVSYFNQTRSGMIQSVMTNDVGLYQSAVMVIRDSIDGPIRAIGAFIAVCFLQWQLAAVAILFLPVMAIVIDRNGKKMRAAQLKVQGDLAELQAMAQEAVYGTRVIKAFAAEPQVERTYDKFVQTSFESQMAAARRLASLRPLVELLGACAIAVVLFVCGVLSLHTKYEISNVAAVLLAFDTINSGVRTLGYVNSTYNQVQAGASRIYDEILNQPEEPADDPSAKTLPAVRGTIEFRNVSFIYADGTQALNNVSFTIEPGSSLALVGYSGAGKSTIADLLQRFYEPTAGEILLDGENLSGLKMQWLRSQIGVVPQHTFLFAGTIAENIRLGSEHATDEEVEAAAHAAHADIFVDAMPNRYATTVGEGGVGLSGGEKQRVAIARAVVRKPRLLILDEATSNLDAVSEKLVQEALDEVMKDRTTLFIAHRLTSAARADQILMLHHGETVEQGTHQELMAKNGPYAAMYRAFSSGVMDETLV